MRSSYIDVLKRQQVAKAIDENSMPAVLARLSKTQDGALFLAWIHSRTTGSVEPDDVPDSALRAIVARKSFGALIFNLLDRGLTADAAGPNKQL